jgi:protein required for attachment to host cells
MRVRVIVADQSEARFYDLNDIDAQLQLAGRLTDPDTHTPAQEPAAVRTPRATDRPVLTDAGRRVTLAPRTADAEPRPRKDAAMRFARQIAAELDSARRRNSFDRIVLIAGPSFIGLLRSALSESVRATLVAEVRKDLVRQDESIVRAYVPPDAFR